MIDYLHMTKDELLKYASLYASSPMEIALVKTCQELEEEVAYQRSQACECDC